MRFRVENLGPLREAEVDLSKDLIVLTGPNNSGKTYLAWSVYGLFNVGRKSPAFVGDRLLEEFATSDRSELDLDAAPVNWSSILMEVCRECQDALPLIFAGFSDQFAASNLSLTSSPGDIRTAGNARGRVSISPNFLAISNWKPQTSILRVGLIRQSQFHSNKLPLPVAYSEEDWARNETNFLQVSQLPAEEQSEAAGARRSCVLSALQRRLFRNCVLFPAERIAVNIFAKELALKRTELVSDLLEALPTTSPADLLQRRAGRYPWPIRDNLHIAVDLQNLSREKTRFADIADALERAVLGGAVGVSNLGELTFAPSEAPDRHLAVHLTASVVKSLASLVFYFRHLAEPGDLLIIDEPELNLHPDNQRKITRILAKAVRRGFKIMMSTHSDYVLREFNHLVMLSKGGEAAERVIDELGYDRETLLTPDQLGVYLFNDHTARAVDVDETGFEVETIEREIAAMNADAQRIYAALFG